MAYKSIQKNKKQDLLALSEELTRPQPDQKKVSFLLKKVGIPESDDPFLITNEILKKLHKYEKVMP